MDTEAVNGDERPTGAPFKPPSVTVSESSVGPPSMRPVAVAVAISAFDDAPDSVTVNVSSFSSTASERAATVNVCSVTPGAKVSRVPATAV